MTSENPEPKISVIIVTRDRPTALPGCIDSIIHQSPTPNEIVLVAGNESSIPHGLLDLEDAVPIVVASCPEPNISLARNIGLDHAQGDLLIFIDDDAQAHAGLIEAYLEAFRAQPDAWAAGGVVLDARQSPASPEFAFGLIKPSGIQLEVVNPDRTGTPRGTFSSVKGCNFALHRARMPASLQFDPFFVFAFDETDLIMRVHEQGGCVVHVPGAVVDHDHAPGAYRAQGPLDRDWRTEFASHTMFMLKHTRGTERAWGWFVVLRRFGLHTARAIIALLRGRITPSRAWACIADAFSGVRFAASSHDSVRSSR